MRGSRDGSFFRWKGECRCSVEVSVGGLLDVGRWVTDARKARKVRRVVVDFIVVGVG